MSLSGQTPVLQRGLVEDGDWTDTATERLASTVKKGGGTGKEVIRSGREWDGVGAPVLPRVLGKGQ